jgi:hypothetical protein
MKYRCLSYPAFEPEHIWLRKVLLFVDEIHRIVPLGEDPHDSDELKALMEHCEGAVHQCPPENYVDVTPEHAQLFGKALERPSFLKAASSQVTEYKIEKEEVLAEGWEFLHIAKIGTEVGMELHQRGMIRRELSDAKWPIVPRGVGALVLKAIQKGRVLTFNVARVLAEASLPAWRES